jgi:Zn-dependent protease
MWLLNGSVSLGVWFGINVRLHASMFVTAAWVLIFHPFGGPVNSVMFCSVLLGSVLLHEFGHCWGSWSVGGSPSEIILTPLGGLALADAPRRAWATFWTVVCGPLVNLALCAISAIVIYVVERSAVWIPWNPLRISGLPMGGIVYYAWWMFMVNWGLFVFNVFWPVFPLDGGQMLQSLLWVRLGYYRSMLIACTVGIGGAIVMTLMGLGFLKLFLGLIGISCLMTCISMRNQVKAEGPWAFEDEDTTYAASQWNDSPTPTTRRKRVSKRVMKKAQRIAQEADMEQAQIDTILAKVSAQGMQSLNWREKRALHKATERQRMTETSSSGKKNHW